MLKKSLPYQTTNIGAVPTPKPYFYNCDRIDIDNVKSMSGKKLVQVRLHISPRDCSNSVVFNLFGGAEPQGCIPMARGTFVHISAQES